MVASQLREPRPASSEPYQPNRAHERAHRRPANQPQIETGRQPRLNPDSLAIGAPLTAALIGVLVTEGDAAIGGTSAGSADGGAAARRGHDEAGATSQHAGTVARLGPADLSRTGEAVASTSGEIFDPVAAEGAEPPTTAAGGGGGETGEMPVPPRAASTGTVGETVLSGDISITLGAGGLLAALGLGGSAADADGAQPDGRIGAAISGSDGDDVIHGTPHDDRLSGGVGNDIIHGDAGDDILDGGAGDDQLSGGAGDDSLLGGAGQDQLSGGTGDDQLFGGSGDDHVVGEEGRDWLDGGSGDDLLDGGPDPDHMSGGAGDDILMSDHLHDIAFGGGSGIAMPGNNTLVVQEGFATHLLQELAEDGATFVFSENLGQSLPSGVAGHHQQVAGDIQNLTLEGTADHDVVGDSLANVIHGNAGDNKLYGNAGDDILYAGGGNNALHGGAGNDVLHGGPGNDKLFGGSDDDILYGGAGDDILEGGRGSGLLEGGAGDDRYLFKAGDGGLSTIVRDSDGANVAELEGFDGLPVRGVVVGQNLLVVANYAPLFTFENFVSNEQTFAGLQIGDQFIPTEDLLA